MDDKNKGLLSANTKIQVAVNKPTAMPGKKIIAGLVCIGVLWCLIDAFGIKGAAFAVSLVACGWLAFCVLKRKPKKIPVIVLVVSLVVTFFVPNGNTGNITKKQLIEDVTKVMQPVGYQLVSTDNMSDNTYFIYVKDSPNSNPRPNGIRCDIIEKNGYVKSVVLVSANGSHGIPMSAMKFVSALNPQWSSEKTTGTMTEILKGQTLHEKNITYTFKNFGTTSQFIIEMN